MRYIRTISFAFLFFVLGTMSIVSAQTVVGGLCGSYQNYVAPPDYQPSEIVLERLDPEVHFDRGLGSPSSQVNINQFFIRWTGKVAATTSGNHVFRTRTDDGIRVYLNGSLIINNRTDHAPTYNSSLPITMTSGQEVDLLIEYYENGGGAVMELEWDTPATSGFVPIPSASLYSIDDDSDGVANCEDCDPNNAAIYQGAPEYCDGLDNDCDGTVDEGFDIGLACDSADDADFCTDDVYVCDGLKGSICEDISGDNTEVCDGLDNDCDGEIDEGSVCIACGDGSINQSREECDDGNLVSNDGCSADCKIEYCRDDAPLHDTSKNFVVDTLQTSGITGTSNQSNSEVAICLEDVNGAIDVFYTMTDASGAFSFVPNFTPYLPNRSNVGIMLHDENGLDIDHHSLVIMH